MSIKVGDKIPAITLKKLGATGMEDIHIADYIKGRKVILFALPGAYTPSCHEKHLPGYVKNAKALKEQGIDEIICLSVNDPFVMQAWGEALAVTPHVTMMPDGNCTFTKAIGMDFDGSGAGLGLRSKRYSMIVDDGVVESLSVDEKPSDVEFSSAEACIVHLKSAA